MSVKLIATDLDGTLMSPDHLTVSQRNINALKKASERGVKIAIATGRTKCLIDMVTEQIPFVDFIIYSNGAVAYDVKKERIIHSDFLCKKTVLDLVDFLKNKKAFYEIYINGESYMENGRADYFNHEGLPSDFINKLIGQINIVDSIRETVERSEVEKINLFSIPREFQAQIRTYVNSLDGVSIASSFADDIEITSKTADKGSALAKIASSLDIQPSEVMSFGDAQNDLEMLKYSGYSFAMGNATPECKEVAKYVTESNALDGLAIAVEKYA